ncbi:hypothetical protein GCM10009789_08860 [Kribbella sancticallisti]|uniref:PKD domain-containing protein n=1 Tax=Kribbella sancticallisti TaxID=460087 RepID=A0ABN2CEU2_9ACTN
MSRRVVGLLAAGLLALALALAHPQLADADPPDVISGEKGLTIIGEDTKRDDRFNVFDPPSKSGRNGSGTGKGSGKKAKVAPEEVDRFPGIEAEEGSCVLTGATDAMLVERGCIDPPPPVTPQEPGEPARPRVEQITTEVVRTELKNVEFPALVVQVQPRTRTLVNLETIVYTKPVPVDRVVPVLTWPVGVRATASSYTWSFGDGSTKTTTSPGRPYPALDVVHRYKKRGAVAVSVVVHYTARYRLPGRGWTTLPRTVDIPGPATALTVAEARPVLVAPER